jgi:hypothetical protein
MVTKLLLATPASSSRSPKIRRLRKEATFPSIMGFLDRFIPKKDAPTGTPSDVGAPPESATGGSPDAPRPASPINMDEATRMINNASKAVEESARSFVEGAKPLGEQLKPIGQSLMADVSNASREFGGALRDLTSPPTSASASTPPASGVGAPPTPASSTPDAPPVTVSPDMPSPYEGAPTAPPSSPVPPAAPFTSDTPTTSGVAPQGYIPPEATTVHEVTMPAESAGNSRGDNSFGGGSSSRSSGSNGFRSEKRRCASASRRVRSVCDTYWRTL